MTRTAVLIPLAMSPVAVGIMFQLMTSPSTGLLSRITGNPNLLNSGGAALTYVIAAQVWSLLGVVTFIFLSGLQAIPEDLYEAAQIDGAGPVRRFWNVTWPLLHGTVTVCVVYVLAMAFRSFSLILALTQGGPYRATEVLALRMYNVAFGTFDRGYGSAVATSLFLIIAAAVVLQLAWIRRDPLRER
jgi:ABC-type sugar transport system permease subunit